MSNYIKFRELHFQEKPFLLGNVWNVQSAKLFERLKFKAIGTSSAAIAHSLGYQDGEQIPFSELLFIVERIIKNTSLPVSVDLEFGYGKNPFEIVQNIQKLHDLGVVGLNIEDSYMENSQRKLKNKEIFATDLYEIVNQLTQKNIALFINVRSDAFLLGLPNALQESIQRISLYEKTPIDGIFLPCIKNQADINQVVQHTKLPLNVMCIPELLDFDTLTSLGVKRISMGNFLNQFGYDFLEKKCAEIEHQRSFKCLFQ